MLVFMEPTKVIAELWARMAARDWGALSELVAVDAVVEWPVTAERITGRDDFVAVNREYPEGWSIRVLHIIGCGDQVVSEVEVPHTGLGLFRAVSLWTVRDGQVVAGREYWTEPGTEEAPAWRARYAERIPGFGIERGARLPAGADPGEPVGDGFEQGQAEGGGGI